MTIQAHWHTSPGNFGDVLNDELLRALSGEGVEMVEAGCPRPHLIACGSILSRSVNSTTVWGAGLLDAGQAAQLAGRTPTISAVRGPMTRRELVRQGVACPEVYGDPALVLPRIWPQRGTVTHELALVPHHVERTHPEILRLARDPRVRIVDICASRAEVLAGITGARVVASSSLHGVIVAHAYGLPVTWMHVSGRVLGAGFKFRDHYLALQVHPRAPDPLGVVASTTVDEVLAAARVTPVPHGLVDRLLAACPLAAGAAARRSRETLAARSPWGERNDLVAAQIANGSYVLDVGCGDRNLSGRLPAGCTYAGVDGDYAAGLPPDDTGSADVAVVSGVIEYLPRPERLIEWVAPRAPRLVLTYALAENRGLGQAVRSGWVSHLTLADLGDMLRSLGYRWIVRAEWHGQAVLAASRVT